MAQQTGTAPDGTPVEGVAGEDAAPIDLRQEEGGLHGGHTIRDHVGKSGISLLSDLSERMNEARDRNDKATDLTLGSFPSLEAANKLVNSTIANNSWAVAGIRLQGIRHVRVDSEFASPTGVEAYAENLRSQPVLRTTYGVSVILVPDVYSGRGFRILTAYPRK